MSKIPDEIKDFLKSYLAYVATVDEDGMPNVVPKGDIAILNENTIVFADLYSHQTKKNLMKNPRIAISVVNPAGYKGYQIKGRAKIIERGSKEYDKLCSQISEGGQLRSSDAKYAVKIKVHKIIDIGYGETADKEIR
jgi:predicted pyridoxine 5'-phosphate oxidase superfamily flavin-nucleotide-binding protein